MTVRKLHEDPPPMPRRHTPYGAEDEPLARVSGLLEIGLELRDENERLWLELDAARARILELEALVECDALAPVYNSRGLFRELAKTIAHCRRYREKAVVLRLDLDGFGRVTERHGHAAGEELLRRIGEALCRSTRLSDAVGRIGGDGFVLILRHLDAAAASGKAEAIRRLVADLRLEVDGTELAVTCSVGWAQIHGEDTPESVLARAAAALESGGARR